MGKHQKPRKPAPNLLPMIPKRLLPWETDEQTNQIMVLVPKFKSAFGNKVCRLFRQPGTFNLKLDEFGTAIWLACDSKTTVEAIGEQIKSQFGDHAEPLYPRLAQFLKMLEQHSAIGYKNSG